MEPGRHDARVIDFGLRGLVWVIGAVSIGGKEED